MMAWIKTLLINPHNELYDSKLLDYVTRCTRKSICELRYLIITLTCCRWDGTYLDIASNSNDTQSRLLLDISVQKPRKVSLSPSIGFLINSSRFYQRYFLVLYLLLLPPGSWQPWKWNKKAITFIINIK